MTVRPCPVCGVRELPPRYRKCDECLVKRRPAEPPAPPRPRLPEYELEEDDEPGGDAVLSCGDVVHTAEPTGERVWCPLCRDRRTVVRDHDGVEVPEVRARRGR